MVYNFKNFNQIFHILRNVKMDTTQITLMFFGFLGIVNFLGLYLWVPYRENKIDELDLKIHNLEVNLEKTDRQLNEFLRLKDLEYNQVISLSLLQSSPQSDERDREIEKVKNGLSSLRDQLLDCASHMSGLKMEEVWGKLDFKDKQQKTIEMIRVFERNNDTENNKIKNLKSEKEKIKKGKIKAYYFLVITQALITFLLLVFNAISQLKIK